MRLTGEQKSELMDRLWEMTLQAYTGVEVPPRGVFETAVMMGDVFVWGSFKIYGFAIVSTVSEPFLWSIVVGPRYRKQGIGGVLLVEIAQFYRSLGKKSIRLTCKVDNPSQRLYFTMGYRVTALLINYYRPEGDGLEMRKIL